MEYRLSKESFSKYFFTNDSFIHKQDGCFKIFPFVSSPNVDFSDVEKIVGQILCQIQDIEPNEVIEENIINSIISETNVEIGAEDLFQEVIKQLFFESDGSLKPLNIVMMEHKTCSESNERKLAKYLADVLGDKSILQDSIARSKNKMEKTGNVLENLLFSKLEAQPADTREVKQYYRAIEGLHDRFEKDFDFILSSESRTRDYLIKLFEVYYFSYTSQTMLLLDRKFDGNRFENTPLFFSLDWEATKIQGKYISEGWNILQEAIRVSYAHAVILEMLNVDDSNSIKMDYVAIRDYIKNNPDEEKNLREVLYDIFIIYKNAIKDCQIPEFTSVEVDPNVDDVEDIINKLYELIRIQFENSASRNAAYGRYSSKFEDYCTKFLKNRGRNGYVLNVTEDTLIFLTKVSIKDKEKMKLSDVFKEFEYRGFFFEKDVREQIADYYEKLNLIEKKSDSGDAKYVKRIL